MQEQIIVPLENELYNEYIQRILYLRKNLKNENEYMEHHHIIPKCLNGNNDNSNLIWLYAQEHYYAHKLLALENPNNQSLQYAWWNMCHCQGATKQRLYEITAEDYEEARSRHAHNISQWMCGKIVSEETKKKQSDAKIGKYNGKDNPNWGKHLSEESKKSISEKNKGRIAWNKGKHGPPHTEEWKQQHALKMTGANNPAAKAVIQYDLNGNFIKIFSTIKEAVEQTGAPGVSDCCKGKQHTSGGFIWKYKDKD